ncbi:hypothetical protein ACIA7S_13795 [Streptomyces sp. NPDC051643]|uniref:hypothetical protein n=1 Tax=Streptomyces sp. NPDC051643 TaxID=3365665 RepID=UPI0037A480EF
MWQARTAARAERNRLAVRLRDAVLHRTSALVELAHRGRLEEVSAEARTALAAVRELLHGLEHGPESERRLAPQPTGADLVALCRTQGASGREVTLRGTLESAAGLPASVTLTAYRMVEAAPCAGDRGPARVRLRRRRGALHLTVTGVRLAVPGPVAERLRVQATAADGRLTLEPAGTVRVLLPLPLPLPLPAGPGPAHAREVSPSPHV